MADLIPILKKHFRVRGIRRDNLPHIVEPTRRDAGRVALAKVLKGMGYTKGVEIGVRAGRSALVWLQNNPEMHLTCIDPWIGRRHEPNYELAKQALSRCNATVLRMTSMDGLKQFEDESLDFVHVDGDHTFDFCAPDIIYWSYKLKRGGMMAVHDYHEFHHAGVLDAVRAYTHCHHIDPWFVIRDRIPTAFWVKQ